MAATWAAIADAVTTLLTTPVTGVSGTISRDYVPETELANLAVAAGPLVSVIGRSDEQTPGRKIWERTVEITVIVQKRVAATADADTWAEFVETLAGTLKRTPILPSPPAELAGLKTAPVYDPGLLREKGVFLSILMATYKIGSVA